MGQTNGRIPVHFLGTALCFGQTPVFISQDRRKGIKEIRRKVRPVCIR